MTVTTGAHCQRPSASDKPNGGSVSVPIRRDYLCGGGCPCRAPPDCYLAAVKEAVASTVPFGDVSRAPVTLPGSTGSGLPQDPYPLSSRNDPMVMIRPPVASSWQMTVPELMLASVSTAM